MALEKSRQMVPGKDTLQTLAKAYGLKPSQARDIIKSAGAELIREDGYRGKLILADTKDALVSSRTGNAVRVVGWEDGSLGVEPSTTKVTKDAIRAISLYSWNKANEV